MEIKIKKLGLVFVLGLMLSACNNIVSEKPKTPEELKFELELQEQLMPLNYLTIEGGKFSPNMVETRSAGLFRDAEYEQRGFNVHGYVSNSASVAVFKDIVLSVDFYSATESKIGSEEYVIYKFIKPGEKVDFNLTTKNTPQGAVKIGTNIIGAKAK